MNARIMIALAVFIVFSGRASSETPVTPDLRDPCAPGDGLTTADAVREVLPKKGQGEDAWKKTLLNVKLRISGQDVYFYYDDDGILTLTNGRDILPTNRDRLIQLRTSYCNERNKPATIAAKPPRPTAEELARRQALDELAKQQAQYNADYDAGAAERARRVRDTVNARFQLAAFHPDGSGEQVRRPDVAVTNTACDSVCDAVRSCGNDAALAPQCKKAMANAADARCQCK